MIYFEDYVIEINKRYENLNNFNYDDGIKNIDSS